VNTHAEYRRHGHRPLEHPTDDPAFEATASQLARQHDPSLELRRAASAPTTKGIAWVRPTELATYAAPIVGRGIDLQAELTRRARRAPATSTRALQRSLPHSPSTPPPYPQEGLQL
jgi:hypothetical protein